MKIETKTLEDHQVELTVEVDPQPFEEAKQRAARRLAKRVKIPGFRPGKAPYPVVVRHLGEPAIVEEAIELLVNEIYPQVIKEAQIEPYSLGELEDIPSLDPLTFKFIVPLKAQVELGDYRSIRIPYELEPVTDKDVESVLNNLRERQALIEPVQRPAQEGDLVRLRLKAERLDAAEGVDPILIKDQPLAIVIDPEDADTTDEYPFPGFSRHLIGMSTDEEKTLTYTYPEDFATENLRGASASFTIRVNQVNQRSLPDLDDEFAKSVGDYDTLDDLRDAIRKDLEKVKQKEYDEEYSDKVLDEIVKMSSIKFPPQMLEREVETVINRLENNLAASNLDLDLYLKTRQIDMEGLKEEAKPIALTRLQRTLTLIELSEKENINVEADELQSETSRTLGDLAYYMQEKELKNMLKTEDSRQSFVSNIMMDMIVEKTMERLRDIARGIAGTDGKESESETQDSTTPQESSTSVEVQSIPEDNPQPSEVNSQPIFVDNSPEENPGETTN